MLHGLFAGAALLTAVRGDRVRGTIMLVVLAAKLAWEAATGGSLVMAGTAGYRVVTESHLLGALGGLAGALPLLWRSARG
ncbi:MAG: hypothetical protein MUO51_17125 [Woeseiaceae bacterium]|nr:hypothetical protein [Woeseiaceae bacterium]